MRSGFAISSSRDLVSTMTEDTSRVRTFYGQISLAVGRQRRSRWGLLVVCALVVSGIELIAAGCIAVLLAVIMTPGRSMNLPWLGSVSIGEGSSSLPILVLGLVLILFFVGRGLLLLLQTYLQARVGHNTGVELSTRLLDGYLRMPYAFHLDRSSAELVRNAYVTTSEVVVYVLTPVVQGVSETLVMLGLGMVLVFTAPIPSLLAGSTIAIAVYLIQRVVRPSLTGYGATSQTLLESMLGSLQQAMTGVREVQLLGARHHLVEHFTALRREHARSSYMRATLVEVPRAAVETSLVAFVIILLLVAVATEDSPREALGVVGLFAYAAFRAVPSVNRLVAAVNNCRFGAASLAIVCRDLELVEVARSEDRRTVIQEPHVETLELKALTFQYEGADRPALRELDVTIVAGESVGLAGATGSGKSTFVHVIAGLLRPTSGDLILNGQKLNPEGWVWSGQLGLVPQEVFLVNDTVLENIALGARSDNLDEDRLHEALRISQLEDVIQDLPAGLQTIVGDRGARLSGGQRQRIALARALYHRPNLLILDEGTSALDVGTEQRLVEALVEAPMPRTILHIAHRLISLKECDRILVFKEGAITDEGSFAELAARNDLFRRERPR